MAHGCPNTAGGERGGDQAILPAAWPDQDCLLCAAIGSLGRHAQGHDLQFVCMQGLSCTQFTWALILVVQRETEFGRPLVCAAAAIPKAFDHVCPATILRVQDTHNVPRWLSACLLRTISRMVLRLTYEDQLTDKVRMRNGIPHGESVSNALHGHARMPAAGHLAAMSGARTWGLD